MANSTTGHFQRAQKLEIERLTWPQEQSLTSSQFPNAPWRSIAIIADLQEMVATGPAAPFDTALTIMAFLLANPLRPPDGDPAGGFRRHRAPVSGWSECFHALLEVTYMARPKTGATTRPHAFPAGGHFPFFCGSR